MNKINSLPWEEFIQNFGNLVEQGPVVAGVVWAQLPFSTVRQFHESLCDVLNSLPMAAKESILRCHPDLAGNLAKLGQLTVESAAEQASAGLMNLSPEEAHTMSRLNAQYKERFHFPFVVCARENKKDAILTGLARRLGNSPSEEVHNGIEEVKKIAWYRLVDVMRKMNSEGPLISSKY